MPAPTKTDADTAREILERYRTWAVVGCRPEPERPSNFVAAALQRHGYRIVPVNAAHAGEQLLGETCHADLLAVPRDVGVEVVVLFRRPPLVPPHVEEAIAIGAKAVWMQPGTVEPGAARRAREAGLLVVTGRCAKTDWTMLVGIPFGADARRP